MLAFWTNIRALLFNNQFAHVSFSTLLPTLHPLSHLFLGRFCCQVPPPFVYRIVIIPIGVTRVIGRAHSPGPTILGWGTPILSRCLSAPLQTALPSSPSFPNSRMRGGLMGRLLLHHHGDAVTVWMDRFTQWLHDVSGGRRGLLLHATARRTPLIRGWCAY